MLPDWKGKKIMGKVSKRVRYDDTSTGEGNYNSMRVLERYYYRHQSLDGNCNNSAQDCIGFTLRLLQLSELTELTCLFLHKPVCTYVNLTKVLIG